MVVIRPACEAEIDAICAFLHTHMDPSISAERFRHLFTYPWKPADANLGFVLEEEGRLAGFLSTIYADREINGRTERFCNLSSWFVLPEYRNHSLSLLNAAHRQGDLVFTNLTSRPAVHKISLALRYQVLDTYKLFSFAGAHFWTLFRGGGLKLRTRPEEIGPLLEPAHQKILRDHSVAGCGHLLATVGGRYCYIVWKRRVKKSVPFCELLFVSDPEILRTHFERIKLAICRRGLTVLMALDERLLGARLPFLYPYVRVSLFKAKRAGRMDIDNLYCELALL